MQLREPARQPDRPEREIIHGPVDHGTKEDIDEMGDLLENNTAAGLLVIEQLWAKPLKKALLDANGVLVAEGRIHPEAAQELDNGGDK